MMGLPVLLLLLSVGRPGVYTLSVKQSSDLQPCVFMPMCEGVC